jgi:hypothetical protein
MVETITLHIVASRRLSRLSTTIVLVSEISFHRRPNSRSCERPLQTTKAREADIHRPCLLQWTVSRLSAAEWMPYRST